MKYLKKNTGYQSMVVYLLWGLVGFCGLLVASPAACDESVADEIISLNAVDRPLGEVLNNIAIVADCQFIVDKSWEDYPITAVFDNEPLYKGLKLIFRDISNAIIYGANRTIRIIIYDEGPSSDETIGHSVLIEPSQESIRQPPTLGAATDSQSEIEISETGSDSEEVEQLPETTDETGSGAQEMELENEDTDDEEPGETEGEETSADLEAEEKENESDAESN
jgi:hypothetical protein